MKSPDLEESESPEDAPSDLSESDEYPPSEEGVPLETGEELPGTPLLDRLAPPLVTLAVGVVLYLGFGKPELSAVGSAISRPLLQLGAVYLVLGGLALHRLRAREELSLLRPRSGDLTFGGLVAALLYGLAFVTYALVTAPGTPRSAWVLHFYLRLGNPLSNPHLLAGGAAVVGLLEELTWRGLVTPALEERLGVGRGNLVGVGLYGLAHVSTVIALADPVVGPNPLLLVGSLGCGAAWTYLRWRLDRLPPALFSHALFTWAMLEFPLYR